MCSFLFDIICHEKPWRTLISNVFVFLYVLMAFVTFWNVTVFDDVRFVANTLLLLTDTAWAKRANACMYVCMYVWAPSAPSEFTAMCRYRCPCTLDLQKVGACVVTTVLAPWTSNVALLSFLHLGPPTLHQCGVLAPWTSNLAPVCRSCTLDFQPCTHPIWPVSFQLCVAKFWINPCWGCPGVAPVVI